jgi:carbon storage regulator CsrA
MLVLTRYCGERVIATIGGQRLEICVVGLDRQGRVRLGFEAPLSVTIHREEIDRLITELVQEEKPAALHARPA